jgi:transcriptional regulator
VYVPPFNAVTDQDELRAMVAAARSGWLVTVGADGTPAATLLPIMWHGDLVIAHLARANPQWRELPPDSPGLIIVGGPEAYVSPTWYAAKAEHGRVVPTWNYTAVQLTGRVTSHHDSEWLRAAVTELTDTHESGRDERWRITDAPETYVEAQLRGIVGIEFRVTGVEGKAKLSQNRSADDRLGVVAGLRDDADTRLAGAASAAARDVADEMSDRPPAG